MRLARRSLIAAAAAVPFARTEGAAPAAGSDVEAFLTWESEFRRFHGQADAVPDEAEAAGLYARAQAIEERILQTRSTSAAAIRVKLRVMIRLADMDAEALALPLRDVLSHLEGLG